MKKLVFILILLAVPALADIRSKFIRIAEGGVVSDDQSRFHFMQIIKNTTERPLWVTVRQGGCEVTAKIEPGKSAPFDCHVDDVQPGKVPVAIDIFADEARTQNLESLRDEMRFSRDDIRALRDLAKAQRLPIAYDGVYYAEKLGAREIFRQLIPHADGKLTITDAALEYVDGKHNVKIPFSSVRRIGFRDAGGVTPYIVVSYQDGDAVKDVGFQALSHPEQARAIVFSLEAAYRPVQDAPEAVPGETLGDAGLRRDTARTILQSEKSLAPDCKAPKIVDTKVVEKLSGVEIKDARPVGGKWSERWVVDRCGTQVAYNVRYTADPQGGTNLAIDMPRP